MILQGWCSDQPPDTSMEILKNHHPNGAIYTTDIFPERLWDMGTGAARMFASKSGHIIVRVQEPGPQQTYELFVLDANRQIQKRTGPIEVSSK